MAGPPHTQKYPVIIQFFAIAEGSPCAFQLYRPLDGRFALTWGDQLTTAFTLDTGPLGQTLDLRGFSLIPDRIDFVPDRDHDLIQIKLLVTTAERYIRGTLSIPSDAYAMIWTPYDQLRLLGGGTFSLFMKG